MITSLAVRFFQLVFGAVVLGLSITAIEWQYFGSAPATTTYCAFAGAFGMLTALIGTAAIFVEAVPDLIMAIVDALASVLFLAGGIAFAIGLRGVSCGDVNETYKSYLLNGGCKGKGDNLQCGIDIHPYALPGRCKMVEADSAFLFLGFLVSVAAAVLCYLASKRGGGARRSAV
ncbi:hypothetical protein LTR36_006529 [Oleoguttula mirabilis]|uniref:MARVEL domain-containing protein n=1 Tax=Oleoguttula mirabilis TaxID=1507867 RepID=A0AAV9JVG7_9PEZI|nr:hypothetical protein LTR36_006529 [Oleoguttula mirabilis]